MLYITDYQEVRLHERYVDKPFTSSTLAHRSIVKDNSTTALQQTAGLLLELPINADQINAINGATCCALVIRKHDDNCSVASGHSDAQRTVTDNFSR